MAGSENYGGKIALKAGEAWPQEGAREKWASPSACGRAISFYLCVCKQELYLHLKGLVVEPLGQSQATRGSRLTKLLIAVHFMNQ